MVLLADIRKRLGLAAVALLVEETKDGAFQHGGAVHRARAGTCRKKFTSLHPGKPRLMLFLSGVASESGRMSEVVLDASALIALLLTSLEQPCRQRNW